MSRVKNDGWQDSEVQLAPWTLQGQACLNPFPPLYRSTSRSFRSPFSLYIYLPLSLSRPLVLSSVFLPRLEMPSLSGEFSLVNSTRRGRACRR